jgi:hypothetical protein
LTTYELIPSAVWKSNKKLRQFLNTRYRAKIEFTSEIAVDLRWAHARGNLLLAKLGPRGSNLQLYPHQTAVQYTTAGHLFVAVSLRAMHTDFPLSDMVSLVVVSAITTLFPVISMLSKDTSIAKKKGTCSKSASLFSVYQCSDLVDQGSVNTCQAIIFDYWRQRRQSNIWIQPWAIKSLNTEDSIPKWHVFQLPGAIYSRITESYLRQRALTQRPEPLISTVFNQLETQTYHIPIKKSALQELSSIVMKETAKWLYISVDDLVETGAYGVREYRKGSVVNWHTDLTASQPLTAMIHIRSDQQMLSDDNTTSDLISDEWVLELADVGLDGILGLKAVEVHEVVLRPGEAIIIESARLPHARSTPLAAAWYGNAFVHMKPKEWGAYIDSAL